MAYRDFVYPQVVNELGLDATPEQLFSQFAMAEVEEGFATRIRRGLKLATAIDTEKARSEFLIAPVLDEARRLLGERPSLFSGVEFNVDPARGLIGRCDFLISRNPMIFTVTAPLVAVAEGKNGVAREGFGQCIASMVAIREFNAKSGKPVPNVYGVSTNGGEWKLMRLAGPRLVIDTDDYFIAELPRLLGVLCHLIEHG